jgi:hypothetical protein
MSEENKGNEETQLEKVYTLKEYQEEKLKVEKKLLKIMREFEDKFNLSVIDIHWSWANEIGVEPRMIRIELRTNL